MNMGRRRQTRLDLPPRMHLKGGTYYYVTSTIPRKWIKLHSDIAKARMLWAQVENGTASAGNGFSDVMDAWMLTDGYTKLSPSTKHTYNTMIRQLRETFDCPIETIRPVHIAQMLDAHPSKAQANIGRVIMSNVFDYAVRRGIVEFNPAREIKKHTIEGRTRHLTDDEFFAIRENGNDVLKCVMDIAYLTGARINDILKIVLSDSREDGLFIEQGKTGKRQLFIWTPELEYAIATAQALNRPTDGVFLFYTNRNRPYTYSAFYSLWERAVRDAGVDDVHFHDIRGNAATEAKRQGQDYQAILGHASRSMSEKYIKMREIERIEPVKRNPSTNL